MNKGRVTQEAVEAQEASLDGHDAVSKVWLVISEDGRITEVERAMFVTAHAKQRERLVDQYRRLLGIDVALKWMFTIGKRGLTPRILEDAEREVRDSRMFDPYGVMDAA